MKPLVPGSESGGPMSSGVVDALAIADLPEAVQDRIPVAMQRAAAKVAAASQQPHATSALLAAAGRARTRPQRVLWLHRWATAWIEPLAKQAPCRRGCSHCCHVPVAMTSAEARLIGQMVGIPPASPSDSVACGPADDLARAAAWQEAQQRHLGVPCPFLGKGVCSIYERRPFTCRTHISLDDDDMLCRLVPGKSVPVPYADTRGALAMFIGAQPGEKLADIREFFPREATDDFRSRTHG